ncbi:hypothetical protein [Bacillus sp. ISL-47]|nr:hypothetical protein [Bacillus sp. ISL-47]MBT2708719.1 hypothetical protein [Pseudomonas sp. ISL-84]
MEIISIDPYNKVKNSWGRIAMQIRSAKKTDAAAIMLHCKKAFGETDFF